MVEKQIVVAVSGGFDPVHIGHIQLFKEARTLGDKLVVILNNDHWLKAKKRFAFMREEERAEVLRAIRYVDDVIISMHVPNDPDRSVARELDRLRLQIFANGADRNEADAANPDSPLHRDIEACKHLGIRAVFNVGGKKIQSSSSLTDFVRRDTSPPRR